MNKAENWLGMDSEQTAWPASYTADAIDESPTRSLSVQSSVQMRQHMTPATPDVAAVLDLGDKDCGDGPLEEVAKALRPLPAGVALEVRTTDGDVAVALLAWCRFMGHTIADLRTGRFLIMPVSSRL